MSGQGFRACLNRLGSATDITGHYLEVGTFRGSTAISTLLGNKRKAFLIDNWSEFGGPKSKAIKSFRKFKIVDRITVIDNNFDYFEASWLLGQPIGIYFYDGGHSLSQQEKAIQIIDTIEFLTLILIVDDWCWPDVQMGTRLGLNRIRATVIAEWQVFPNEKDKKGRYGNWHNGYFFAILEKIS
jgi:hypothetical protein